MSFEILGAETPPQTDAPLDAGPGIPPIDSAPVTPAPELQQLSETFGGDFTQFTSVDDAQRAARLIAENYARSGFTPAPQQYAEPPQRHVPVEDITPADDDWAEVDPKVVSKFKRLEQELQRSKQEIGQFQEQFTRQQQEFSAQQQREIFNRATHAIDALQAPEFGVGGSQNYTQISARERLLSTADRIINGMQANGKQVPTIEKVIEMAALLETGRLPGKKAAAPAPGAAPPVQRSGAGANPSPPPRSYKGNAEEASYLGDKDFMEGAKAIVARNSR